jgi:hypothetical protein
VLLKVLGDPPVVFLLKVADRDETLTASDGELLLAGRPGTTGGSTVDTEDDKGRVPLAVLKTPDIGVTILRTRENTKETRSSSQRDSGTKARPEKYPTYRLVLGAQSSDYVERHQKNTIVS